MALRSEDRDFRLAHLGIAWAATLIVACAGPPASDAGPVDAYDAGMDVQVEDDAGAYDSGPADAGNRFPPGDGDVPCGSDTCLVASGSCCPRPDGTWYCCGGFSRCAFDAGMCECNGRDPCELGFFCCGDWDAGFGCVDRPTYEACLAMMM